MSQFECVRITSMADVDLDRYAFNYDLTFCILLMRADGHHYHTYGGRTGEDPHSHLSVESLTAVLLQTLAEVRESPPPPPAPPSLGRTVEDYPPLARRIAADRRPPCVHCHNVNDWWMQTEVEAGRWSRDRAWIYPDPSQLGLTFDSFEQNRLTEAPAKSGLRIGDRIVTAGGTPVLTFGDFSRALDRAPAEGSLALEVVRSSEPGSSIRLAIDLALPAGWRKPSPRQFAWRAIKWNLQPAPGFGGPVLSPAELRSHGLPADGFAFRIQYFVTWGPRRNTGINAGQAGLREGDLVLSAGGRDHFDSIEHFHAWFRLTRKVGELVPIEILRGEERLEIELPVVGPKI